MSGSSRFSRSIVVWFATLGTGPEIARLQVSRAH